MNIITDEIDFENYFAENQDEGAKVRPASQWCDEVIDRVFGQSAQNNWTPIGFSKAAGNFDLRIGEVTAWAGVNGNGKTTFLSHAMLNVMASGQKVCLASLEMKPRDSMFKMTLQALGLPNPSAAFIRAFHKWTDSRLWVYDHLGRVAASRMLAVATYVRKELGVDHLVIDSLMKCGIGPEDYAAQKDFVDGLCALARDTGLSIHLVCHMRKGENERQAPGKFDVKGAGEITDLIDNLVIIWKNQTKQPSKPGEAIDTSKPDAYVRVAKQRHHSWEGSFAFWFDKPSQQFLENERARPQCLHDLNRVQLHEQPVQFVDEPAEFL